MKVANTFRKVFLIIGVIVIAAGYILIATIGKKVVDTEIFKIMVFVTSFALLTLITGAILGESKTDVTHRVGISLSLVGATTALIQGLTLLLKTFPVHEDTKFLIASIVILSGLLIYALSWFMVLVMYTMARKDSSYARKCFEPEDDVHIAAIMKWKKLYQEGIITEREFIDKRDEILGLNNK